MKIDGFLLDVEGVLVADKRYTPVQGAVGFVRWLRDHGVPFRLITNNTTDAPEELLRKLAGAGFDFAAAELHTCTGAAVAHLRANAVERCLVLGTERLRALFRRAGFAVVDEADVGAVVVGLDTDLTYERLRLACDAVLRHQAALVALHRNRVFTDGQGRCAPSVGAIVEAVRYATGAEPEVIGKPSPTYFQQALDELFTPPERVMVVSDDPFSDLAGAKLMGMKAALVLSGKYSDPTVVDQVPEDRRPDCIVARIGDLLTEEWLDR